jgi:hypothetical protein
MVIGLLAIAAIPTVTGVGQAVSAQKQMNAQNKEQVKFNLTAMIEMGGEFREGCFCVLADDRVRSSKCNEEEVHRGATKIPFLTLSWDHGPLRS